MKTTDVWTAAAATILRRLCAVGCCLLVGIAGMNAQDDAEAQKKKINSIKKNPMYLYAEATLSSEEEAIKLAGELLDKEIQEYVQGKKKYNSAELIVTRNTASVGMQITLPRGNMYRAFAYVKKSDVLPSDNVNVAVMEKKPEEQPLESIVEAVSSRSKGDAAAANPALERILALQQFSELQPCLTQLKREGYVTDFNKYAALERPEEYVLIIYNREARIEAVLSEGTERVNLKTNAPDGVAHYKGRGAIGVKIKK